MDNERNSFLDKFFMYLITGGMVGGTAFAVLPSIAIPGVSSIFFSLACSCLVYQFMGGIKDTDSFQFGDKNVTGFVVKLSSSIAALVGLFLIFNLILKGQVIQQKELNASLSQAHPGRKLEIKSGPLTVGELDVSELNAQDYYYIKDKNVVEKLAALKTIEPPYEYPVLTAIRDDCKEFKGVCEYKFKVDVRPGKNLDPKNYPDRVAAICGDRQSQAFWEKHRAIDITDNKSGNRLSLSIDPKNMDLQYNCSVPKKVFLFRPEDQQTLGLAINSKEGRILDAEFSP